jgi:eukaryotic-like serine/threonine-protein kinase
VSAVDGHAFPGTSPHGTVAGRVGDRYVLRGELGRGGMATVHRALDDVLEREVAVKLLHAHLADDPAFLDRFRREARAAAALDHPNVVAVHDWGETDEGAYLVLQLVEGPSLRDVLRRHGRLDPAQALAVLGPAARGLGAAHVAGLVHRDVKPENLLLGRDGTVRVTDFGLARAAASATSTFGADVLVGSPHYLSPEAVRGRPLDPRADVYALGVVLFECLTGRPPHEGESPFATAVQHTSRRVPPPSEHVDGIPPAIDELVVAATAHDPDDRPDDGRDFADAFAHALPEGPSPLTLDQLIRETIVVPATADDELADHDADGADPAVGTLSIPPTAAPTTLVRGDGPPPPPGSTRSFLTDDVDTDQVGRSAGGIAAAPGGDLDEEDDLEDADLDGADDEGRRRRRWPLVLLVLVALLAASAAGGYLLWDRVLAPLTPIPAVEGASGEVAMQRLAELGFDVTVDDERPHHLEVPEGHVLEQSLTGEARRGTPILLVLSGGPRQVEVPDVVGERAEDATASLVEAGLDPTSVEEHDEEVAAGLVLSTDPPAGAVLDETSQVQLVVSRGPRPIEVADVRGRPLDEATAVIREAGLQLEVAERRYDEATAAGTVLGQDPAPGEVLHRGDTVTVVVSRGPEPVAVPNVRGKRSGEAVAELEALGFEVRIERRGGFGAFINPDRVFDQDPAPEATRRRGDTVTLYAYEG